MGALQVVCIDAEGSNSVLVAGRIYEVECEWDRDWWRIAGAHEKGFPNDNRWLKTRFRPLKTTSIECFKALLAPVNKKQEEQV